MFSCPYSVKYWRQQVRGELTLILPGWLSQGIINCSKEELLQTNQKNVYSTEDEQADIITTPTQPQLSWV